MQSNESACRKKVRLGLEQVSRTNSPTTTQWGLKTIPPTRRNICGFSTNTSLQIRSTPMISSTNIKCPLSKINVGKHIPVKDNP